MKIFARNQKQKQNEVINMHICISKSKSNTAEVENMRQNNMNGAIIANKQKQKPMCLL